MRIGIDFDNTIAGYDRLFARLALEEGLSRDPALSGKQAVRALARASAGGDLAWQRLQAEAYGPRLDEAEPYDGVHAFLAAAKAADVPVFVISHKTRFAAQAKEKVDLHVAALGWLEEQGFLDETGCGLPLGSIHFETTRAAKIARIAALDLTCFIDDLEEVLGDPAFPRDVQGILFDPAGVVGPARGLTAPCFHNWHEIQDYVFRRRH